MANFEIGKDRNGTVNFIITGDPVSRFAVNLAASTPQGLTLPSDVNLAIFQYEPGANVFVTKDASIAFPGGIFATYNADLNVPGLYVSSPGTLLFLSDTTAYVVIKFYRSNPSNG